MYFFCGMETLSARDEFPDSPNVQSWQGTAGGTPFAWRIEDYFRILKSGCKVEELQHHTAERLDVRLTCLNGAHRGRSMRDGRTHFGHKADACGGPGRRGIWENKPMGKS